MTKLYTINEMFASLQGEGYHAGRKAVFVRFAGCNLGYEVCPWCDTDWARGYPRTAADIAVIAAELWAGDTGFPPRFGSGWCVLTGGEPTLQADEELILALKREGFRVQIETNGTRPLPPGLDWVTVSPKGTLDGVVVTAGNEVKIAWPQPGLDMERLASWPFEHRFVQPIDGPDRDSNARSAIDFVMANPSWRLSIQIHKILGLR